MLTRSNDAQEMRKTLKHMAAALALVAGSITFTACGAQRVEKSLRNVTPTVSVTSTTPNVLPGQTMNVVMAPYSATNVQRCLDMGGIPTSGPTPDTLVCLNVDH